MRNLEQKYHCTDLAQAEAAALAIGATDRGVLHQRDLFFSAPQARLKLRITYDREGGELIAYNRSDTDGARVSEYTVAPVSDAGAMIVVLTQALGPPRELVKTRRLFLYKSTRIHLDKVEGVGTFVELETVLTHQSQAAAEGELAEIVTALRIEEPVGAAYVDMRGAAEVRN